MSSERHRLVVGVDYGTTYSGIAYLHTNKPDYREIEVIQTWPGKGGDLDNRTLDKAPTEISFETGGNLWGYQLAPGAKCYGCFKLLLDAKTGKTKHDDPSLESSIDPGNPNARLALPPGKDVNDVTFEYLSLLYEHTVQQLRKRLQVTFDSTPIQFVLTTPAIWSHLAQDATLKAAKKAGFGSRPGDTITMISEPEAAASYCLREMHSARNGSESPLREGQRILICDAGGGTVDLITYTISQTSPCLRVKEAKIGTGGKCGSTAIDRAFLKFLESRVGAPFKKWSPKKTGRGSTIMSQFEMAKKGFGTSSHNQSWRIPVGNVEDNIEKGIEDCELTITNKEMAEIFDPTVRQILQLVAEQVRGTNTTDDEKVSTILLVGGFGESQYLFTKLKEWCKSQEFPIDVINPNHSWSAVVRGAVIHGIESIVEARKLKLHYGVGLACPFQPGRHDEEDAFFDPILMKLMTNDNVVWIAKKGEDATTERRIPLPCFATFPEWQPQRKMFEIDLKGCRFDDAPVSPKSYKVETVGQVKADLSSIADSQFMVLGNTPRGRIFAAEFTIEMAVGSAELTFSLIHDGVSYGGTPIEY